ncbi:MAG: acetate--CoA ligase family protein [Deltaproteobacteria bacterium]|nr:acetate--CoA ligase family protein [Deltaproteobacteria bacterium]
MDDLCNNIMLENEAVKLLGRYGIPYPEHELAFSADEAVEIAQRLGFPVVLKIVAKKVSHKTDVGGVALQLNNSEMVRETYIKMTRQVLKAVPDADIKGILVCRQADEGTEVIVGGIHDSVFGPTVMFGLGGVFAEVLRDVSFRVVPFRRIDAEEMIREIKGYPVLNGIRGQEPCDIEALADLLICVSGMLEKEADITELDLNPVRVYENGLLALDARIIR